MVRNGQLESLTFRHHDHQRLTLPTREVLSDAPLGIAKTIKDSSLVPIIFAPLLTAHSSEESFFLGKEQGAFDVRRHKDKERSFREHRHINL